MRHTGFWLPIELTRRLPSYYMTASEPRDVSGPDCSALIVQLQGTIQSAVRVKPLDESGDGACRTKGKNRIAVGGPNPPLVFAQVHSGGKEAYVSKVDA